ncbi:MAG: Xaa-Pro peptidase family protein [Candidatus ainarchaeum sp.]|jgi:Xaa-Pro aminopeptidase|nr:Xaa-Pro peptidase family protein [Candidatus ainarchaeum sp.]
MVWNKVDSIILFNFKNYWIHPLINKYLETKENTTPSEHYEGILILRKNKKPLWLSHPFNYTQAKKTFLNAEVKSYKTKKELEKILEKYCGKKIGFDARHTAVSTLKSLRIMLKREKMFDVSKYLETIREIKDDSEIEKIKKASKKTREVLDKIKTELKEGITEKEIYWKIKNAFEEDGFELGFCIVAFGKNTSNIHHVSDLNKLKKENAIMIDAGAKYKGYYADITQSYWFGEKEPIEFTKIVKKANEALLRVEEKLKESTISSELWKACKMKMPHALGHGIGIEEHDHPGGIGDKSKWKLKKGMILAIEPAIYKKDFGVRIEFDYLITKTGFEKL